MRTAEERFVRQENWRLAAGILSHLSELQLTLGEVAEALENAVQSVTYAGHTGDGSTRLKRLPTLAFVLHQAGRRPEAQARFREAEQMQAEIEPDHPFLYSLRGFQYCDLLLSEAERAAWRAVIQGVSPPERTDVEESTSPQERALVERELGTTFAALHAVADRAKQTLKWVTPQGRLLDMAQNQLTQGCAALYEAILAGTLGDLRAPAAWLDAALSGLRRAGQLDELPRGLLIRALLRSFTGALIGSDSAQSDLDEAWEIAERGPMRLFQADIHLHRARLFFRESEYPWESPQHDLAEARRLIFKHGYLRRRDELDDAEAALREFKR